MIIRKVILNNGEWVFLIRSGEQVAEIYSNGLVAIAKNSKSFAEIENEIKTIKENNGNKINQKSKGS